jgi:hypothetical protein
MSDSSYAWLSSMGLAVCESYLTQFLVAIHLLMEFNSIVVKTASQKQYSGEIN